MMTYEELLKKISPVLRRIAYKLGAHHSHFDQGDLYQEALVHLWRRFEEGVLDDKTDSYILQGCYFHLKNYIRTESDKGRLVSFETPVSSDGTTLSDTMRLVDEEASTHRESLHGKMLLEELINNGFSPREKSIIAYLSEGLTTREMGLRLGISHVRVVKLIGELRVKCQAYKDF